MEGSKMYPNPSVPQDSEVKFPTSTPYQPPTGQPVVVGSLPSAAIFRETPVEMDCPRCNAHIVTSTETQSGMLAWVICLVMALIGWVICLIPLLLSWLPFCIDPCKDVLHRCPSCNNVIGSYKRLG